MIINATPHPINIYRKEDCKYDESQRKLIVKRGAEPVVTIESSGKLLNVHTELHISEITDEGIPIFYEGFVSADHPASQFPQYETGDIIVVSRQYANVASKRYPDIVSHAFRSQYTIIRIILGRLDAWSWRL